MTRLLTAALFLTTSALPAAAQDTWDTFHGQLSAQKYAPADEITVDNVRQLERQWTVHTGDMSDGSGELPPTVWSATPIYANDTLYLGTPFYRIFALDPATGEQKWVYDSQSRLEALTQPALKSRGVAYWEDPNATGPCAKRVYIGTMTATMHAVDADTGEPCMDFGVDGILDVNQWNVENARWPLSLLQPPTVVGDVLVTGWAGKDWATAEAPPGTVFGIDARTGELRWQVNFLPEDVRNESGTANVWTAMSADPELGLVYLPVSSPSPNYWGGNRTEELPLATSVTAVDVETGEIAWSQQLVHHDIWDYDTNAAPTLMDLEMDGETVPALVQTTKQGFLYVMNRETGEPIFEWEERPVPASDIEGEQASPTQPFPVAPPPTNDPENWPGVWWLADLVSLGGCSRQVEGMRYEGLYTPPSVEGTLAYPATAGGMQWGGASVDPESGLLYVNASRVVQEYRLIPREEYDSMSDGGSFAESGYYAQEGAPYAMYLSNVQNWAGMPCWKPPFGTMIAYDIAAGEKVWEVPFGGIQRYGFYMPKSWGTPTIGGPVVTGGGVIFIGASIDSRVRALDAETGEELWWDNVMAPAVANPAVYEHEGRQWVVFAAGGNSILKPEVGDEIAAYALPE
ncbi:quinoprotein glucose dehydrogenase [Palleronia marisminoris]|uniref:Quinate/shikimate dehydrogenase (Quinone) n=1 Tax=Palleronia marisminoris TaxID=315423 RepID=A0A1Y5SR78_9RHOB|nr:pyrroloquinoline quinone-dependent dehydrogenase [Palleronia marisminoris]SFG94720.1 quinoprotein glucose dehydrogenase [Palleronia marisminoris]SLN46567.1 Quinate/shikimate dehydrogenase (quinone) [Palleronia marisminoris]